MAKSSETWVVTGASRGLGLEYVKQLLAAGASVVATVRSVKSSPELQALHLKYGHLLTVVVMNVGDFASIKMAAKAVDAAHPAGIDFLVANAGIAKVKQDENTPDIELDPEEFDEFFHVNVAGLFATIKAFYPLLQRKEGGRKTVLNMSSIMGVISEASAAARHPEKPLGLTDGIMLAYKASKTAVTQITAQLAQSLKSEGFTFVAMHPGLVSTNAGDSLIQRAKTAVGEETASKFYITPEVSVSKQLAYLATVTQAKDNGRFVGNTGEDLPW